jgi:hypothetical protein
MSKIFQLFEVWWAVQDSNLRPPVCKTDALPTELTAPNISLNDQNCKVNQGESQKSSQENITLTAFFVYSIKTQHRKTPIYVTKRASR